MNPRHTPTRDRCRAVRDVDKDGKHIASFVFNLVASVATRAGA